MLRFVLLPLLTIGTEAFAAVGLTNSAATHVAAHALMGAQRFADSAANHGSARAHGGVSARAHGGVSMSMLTETAGTLVKNGSPQGWMMGLVLSIFQQTGIMDRLDDAYSQADSDGDGKITAEELAMVLSSTGDEDKAAQAPTMFADALSRRAQQRKRDTSADSSDRIDKDEFLLLYIEAAYALNVKDGEAWGSKGRPVSGFAKFFPPK